MMSTPTTEMLEMFLTEAWDAMISVQLQTKTPTRFGVLRDGSKR